jgi:Flp pilus assembly pilin Flp
MKLLRNWLGTTWEQIGNRLRTDWEHIGNRLGTDRELIGNRFGNTLYLGTEWELKGDA